MDAERLFPLPPLPEAPPAATAQQRRTVRQRQLLAAGVHPATRQPLRATDDTCRTCRWAVLVEHGHRRYWKCQVSRLGTSRSAASDIRVSWPACNLYEESFDV